MEVYLWENITLALYSSWKNQAQAQAKLLPYEAL